MLVLAFERSLAFVLEFTRTLLLGGLLVCSRATPIDDVAARDDIDAWPPNKPRWAKPGNDVKSRKDDAAVQAVIFLIR